MKKFLRNGLLLLLTLFLFRGWLFRLLVSYHPMSEHSAFALTNQKLIQAIENQQVDTSIEKIIKRSLDFTASNLRFTSGKNDIDPNLLFESQTAHCVGYAAFFNTACQALLHKAKLEKRYRVSHLRGKISFLGYDLHRLFDSPFFRDHDFNMVEDLQTGKKYYLDASLEDVLGIGHIGAE